MSTKFAKKFEKFSNAENYYQNRRKSTLSRTLSSAFDGMKNCRPSGNSVGRQNFFCGDVTQAAHAHCPNPPIPPYGAGAAIWAVGFLFCGEQPLNILEVVGLRAPTAVETCHWHVSKSRLSNPTFGAKKQQPSEWMAVVLAEKVGFEFVQFTLFSHNTSIIYKLPSKSKLFTPLSPHELHFVVFVWGTNWGMNPNPPPIPYYYNIYIRRNIW